MHSQLQKHDYRARVLTEHWIWVVYFKMKLIAIDRKEKYDQIHCNSKTFNSHYSVAKKKKKNHFFPDGQCIENGRGGIAWENIIAQSKGGDAAGEK